MVAAIFSYVLQSAVVLSILYACYNMAFVRSAPASARRSFLITIYLLALLLPALFLFRAPVPAEQIPAAQFTGAQTVQLQGIPSDAAASAPAEPSHFWAWMVGISLTGSLLLLLFTAVSFLRLTWLVNRGEAYYDRGCKFVRIDGSGAFTFLNRICIPRDVEAADADMIAAHELSHLRHYHSLDLLLARAVCVVQWWNPFVWLMLRELHQVHEFQADADVISSGVDARTYQLMLIRKAVGTRFPTLTDSLSHSKLKQRITMMKKSQIKGRPALRGLVLVPAGAVSLAVLASMPVRSMADSVAEAELFTPREFVARIVEPSRNYDSKVTESSSETQISRSEAVFDAGETLAQPEPADASEEPENASEADSAEPEQPETKAAEAVEPVKPAKTTITTTTTMTAPEAPKSSSMSSLTKVRDGKPATITLYSGEINNIGGTNIHLDFTSDFPDFEIHRGVMHINGKDYGLNKSSITYYDTADSKGGERPESSTVTTVNTDGSKTTTKTVAGAYSGHIVCHIDKKLKLFDPQNDYLYLVTNLGTIRYPVMAQ